MLSITCISRLTLLLRVYKIKFFSIFLVIKMPRKTSRNHRRYLANKHTYLPPEVWRHIFLFVKDLDTLKKVNRQFRAIVSEERFLYEHTIVHGMCQVIGCSRFSCKIDHRRTFKAPESKYCFYHTCRCCLRGLVNIFDSFCVDCRYTCDVQGCPRYANIPKRDVPTGETRYCENHGCRSCGIPITLNGCPRCK